MTQSAIADHEMRYCNSIGGSFNAGMIDRLNNLLQLQPSADGGRTAWQNIKSDPGKAGLESIKEVVARERHRVAGRSFQSSSPKTPSPNGLPSKNLLNCEKWLLTLIQEGRGRVWIYW